MRQAQDHFTNATKLPKSVLYVFFMPIPKPGSLRFRPFSNRSYVTGRRLPALREGSK
jgi:hypothetical protein